MLEFDEEMDTVLLRLTNNDRIIGQVINADDDVIAIYAPMLIEIKTVGSNIDYVFSPYDPLSSTVMALMSHDLIMTVTVPKEKILQQYDDSWLAFYPSIGDVRKKFMEKKSEKSENEFLDLDILQEMFKSILSDSVPFNKKKLN